MEAEEGRSGGQYKGGLSLSEPAVLREPQSQCQGALAESWDWRRIGLFLHYFFKKFSEASLFVKGRRNKIIAPTMGMLSKR